MEELGSPETDSEPCEDGETTSHLFEDYGKRMGDSGMMTFEHLRIELRKSQQSPPGPKPRGITLHEANSIEIWEPHAEVSKVLNFRKFWSFNHPVYAAQLRVTNRSDGHISYKIIPSNEQKLCIKYTNDSGVLDPKKSTVVQIVTHSMVPYKYVDIGNENVSVAIASVELHKRPMEKSAHWDQLKPSQIENFWNSLTSKDMEKDRRVRVYKIEAMEPYDKAYLLDKSSFWRESSIWKIGRKINPWDSATRFLVNISKGLRDLTAREFAEERHRLTRMAAMAFPAHFDLDATQEISRNKRRSELQLKKKMLKFIILGIFFYPVVYFGPAVMPLVLKAIYSSILGEGGASTLTLSTSGENQSK